MKEATIRKTLGKGTLCPSQPAPKAPAVCCLVDLAELAPVDTGRGGLRRPSSRETPPGPGLGPTSGHQRRSDINGAVYRNSTNPNS